MQIREGIYLVGSRCYNVASLFEECTPRRERISQNAARLYRSGRYLGNCMIMYEVDQGLCAKLRSK
jgi:hypothetical protein